MICRPASGGCYHCTYTPPPSYVGCWVLEVLLNRRHARGSPFAVQVQQQLVVASSAEESAAAATALEVPAITSSNGNGVPLRDMVSWWGQVAAEEYAAVDGSLKGFAEPVTAPEAAPGPEEKYVQVRGHLFLMLCTSAKSLVEPLEKASPPFLPACRVSSLAIGILL